MGYRNYIAYIPRKEHDKIKLELLQSSHLEHFKAAKDLAMILPLKHPKRVAIEKACDDILAEIHKLKGNK